MEDKDLLKKFLEFPLWNSDQVFAKFKEIDDHIYYENENNQKERFLFVRGSRENKVVLIAHADTYFDISYGYGKSNHIVIEEEGFFLGKDDNNNRIAIGADDRAGCAILWLLKDSGHSLLITDGEEHGRQGSNWLMNNYHEIAKEINNHKFMIQLDRRNARDYKCYYVRTDEFRKFIKNNTGYTEPDRSSATDICTLCIDICGVNFSIGYYNEHTYKEKINFSEWSNTLNMLRELLKMICLNLKDNIKRSNIYIITI